MAAEEAQARGMQRRLRPLETQGPAFPLRELEPYYHGIDPEGELMTLDLRGMPSWHDDV